MENNNNKPYDFLAHFILIGDASVGKTCLCLKYFDDSFTNDYIATLGLDFKEKLKYANEKKVQMKVWDTAGQERFRTLSLNFYKKAHVIIIVFDVTNKETFNEIPNWLSSINEHGNESVIRMIVANKIDAD